MGIDSNILKMYEMCSGKSLSMEELANFLKKNNIKLDRYAMDYLMRYHPDVSICIMQNYNCMPSVISAFKNSGVPKECIEKYMKENNISGDSMFEPYDIEFVG
jgi:tRNA uridine 5-carbamoylmethylation protein Kti12